MGFSRNVLLWMSENKWMKTNVPKWWFVRKALKKFMPGETADIALEASKEFFEIGIPTVFTKLGENISNLDEANEVRDHYLKVIDIIAESKLDVELSIKLTQLGFDLSEEETLKNFLALVKTANEKLGNSVFIDMEGSAYTQRTIEFYKNSKEKFDNVGLCMQAYLYSTEKSLEDLFKISPSIRLVKGAYKEPDSIAFPEKPKVDENYFLLAQKFMNEIKKNNIRVIFATHDENLITKITEESRRIGLNSDRLEFQMLYGIKTSLQKKLAKDGFRVRVLVAYGESWYPWYMRRLAERPANIWFVLKNIFS